MKIFGIGLSKTGTKSTNEAMKKLGFKTIHLPFSIQDIDLHESCFDITVTSRYQYLDRQYPNSKFIYTTREINDWLKSCDAHYNNSDTFAFIQSLNDQQKIFLEESELKCYGRPINDHGPNFDRDIFTAAYLRHDQEVKKYFENSDRLLILNLREDKDCWKKIIDFTKPKFPHII